MFTLKPFAEIVAASKEKIDEALAPVRARQVRAQADVQVAKLEEEALNLEREIQELCTRKDIPFDQVLDKIDDYELTQRRIGQFNELVEQLFPAKSKSAK